MPMAVWREGAAPGACGHVDNACALTTCPQADQNQQQTRTLGGLIKDNQQTAFQLNRRQKRSRCAGPLHTDRVCEQDVPGHSSKDARTRTDVDHSVDDDGSPAVDGAALRGDPVDRLIFALRVHVPHDPAVSRRVGAKPSVESPGEHQPLDDGYGGRLCGTASWDIAAAGMWDPPNLFSRIEFQGR